MSSPVRRTCDEAADAISKESWVSLEKKALLIWSDLDKFGDVHANVDWGKGPIGQCVHDTCRLNLSSAKKLKQATVGQKKQEVNECQAQSSSVSRVPSPTAAPAAKRLRSTLGVIHDRTKCVWCCKTETAKHPESKLKLISSVHACASFKSHVRWPWTISYVMRDRINCLIESAGDLRTWD